MFHIFPLLVGTIMLLIIGTSYETNKEVGATFSVGGLVLMWITISEMIKILCH